MGEKLRTFSTPELAGMGVQGSQSQTISFLDQWDVQWKRQDTIALLDATPLSPVPLPPLLLELRYPGACRRCPENQALLLGSQVCNSLVGVWSLEMASSAWGSRLHPFPYASAEPFKGVTH